MEKTNVALPIEILAIGGSAGSFSVLAELIPQIKADILFPIVILLHRKAGINSSITDVFNRKTSLPVIECEDKDVLKPGVIYFAPPDYHLLLENDLTFSLDYSEKINFSRPSIDVSFKNFADLFNHKMAAILLSGANNDGAEGLEYIHKKNGTTIVQDLNSSEIDVMPKKALSLFKPTYIANPSQIIKIINSL